MIEKSIDTLVPVLPVFAKRYSGVSYDPERSVSPQDMLALIEAARWAPSCHGDQPWRYVICDRTADRAAWEAAWACLLEGNQVWCRAAPVLMVACCDSVFTKNGKPNAFGSHDTGAASVCLSLQAAALGLMVHQMRGFVPEKAREAFQIPERFTPLTMIAVGYQLPEGRLPEDFRERELKARVRNPLDQNFFAGTWGRGFTQSQALCQVE